MSATTGTHRIDEGRLRKTRDPTDQNMPRRCENSACMCRCVPPSTSTAVASTHAGAVYVACKSERDRGGDIQPTRSILFTNLNLKPQSTMNTRTSYTKTPPQQAKTSPHRGVKIHHLRMVTVAQQRTPDTDKRHVLSSLPHHLGLYHSNLPVELLPRDPGRHHHRVASRERFAPHAERIVRDRHLRPVRVVCHRARCGQGCLCRFGIRFWNGLDWTGLDYTGFRAALA